MQQINCEFWIWHSVYWEYSPGGTTVSHFAILQHINFTFDSSVRHLLRSALNWFLLSTDLNPHCWLFLSSVSHPLKFILYRQESEYPVEPFNFLHLLLVSSLPRNLTVNASVSVIPTYYISISNTVVVSVFITTETETSSNCRHCLAMDVHIDSYNQPLSGMPQYELTSVRD
jgi:hypothetical protein